MKRSQARTERGSLLLSLLSLRRATVARAVVASVAAFAGCSSASAPNGQDGSGDSSQDSAASAIKRGGQAPGGGAAATSGAGAASSATTLPLSNRLALVYRGPVVGCDGCSEAIADRLKESKWGLDVHFVGPDETITLTAASLQTTGVYAQPGGDGDVAQSEAIVEKMLGGANVMSDWVKAGGRFYGTCMGGFFAAKAAQAYPRVSDDPWTGFGLLSGTTGEWIESSGANVKNDSSHLVELLWRGQARKLYFQDGPYFMLAPGANATVLATYQSNGQAAAVVAPLGSGKVGVVGPHPEAEQDWYDSEGLTDPGDPDGSQGHAHDLAEDLIDTLMQ